MIPPAVPNPLKCILNISLGGSIGQGGDEVMNANRRHAIYALQILVPLLCAAFGTASAADAPGTPAAHLATSAGHLPRAPLDLRVPDLRRVMSHRELLAEMGTNSDEESI